MGTSRTLLTRHLLLACSFGAWLVCVNAQADGTGEIVITRHVYPRAVGSIVPPPDPNPTTVNANPAAQINAVTTHGELGDGDFARVSTGSSITRVINTGTGSVPGLLNQNSGMPGLTSTARAGGGSVGGSLGSLGGQINRSVEQGMRPLTSLGGQ